MDKYEARRRELQALTKHLGHGGIAAVASKIGKQPSYVSRMLYKAGKSGRKRIGEDSYESLKIAYPEWFGVEIQRSPAVTGTDTVAVASDETPPGYVRLPQYAVEVSAGEGAVLDDSGTEVVQYLDVAEWWAEQNLPRDRDRIRVLSVRGDSMAPDMQHGDVLFVDTSVQHFDAPGLYVLHWQGRALVKRLTPELKSGRLVIASSNRAYEPEFVEPGEIDQLHIGGRVAAWWTLRKF